MTDGAGSTNVDFLEISHFMRNPEVAERVDYTQVTFRADGYQEATLAMEALKANPLVVMQLKVGRNMLTH